MYEENRQFNFKRLLFFCLCNKQNKGKSDHYMTFYNIYGYNKIGSSIGCMASV